MSAANQQDPQTEDSQGSRAQKVFVTGGSGFVGGAVIAALLQNGYRVTAMARSEKSMQKVSARGAVPVKCDLSNVEAAHLAGVDAVIHSAALAEEWGTDDQFHETNVRGTERLLQAAQDAGVKRFVFVGTEAALFDGHDLSNVDESHAYALQSPFPYSRTKALAEKLVLEANSDHFMTMAIKPRFVWGPGDETVLPTLLELIDKNEFMWISNGNVKTSTTYIDNLVHALILSLKNGKGGQAYFVADDEISTLREFLTSYMGTRGVIPPEKNLPKFVAVGVARIVDRTWKLFHLQSKPPIVRFTIEMLAANCTVNTAKAKAELGYKPLVSVADGLRITAEASK